MFVRLARNQEEQTLVAYQHCGEVYFTTVKVVKPTLLHPSSKQKFIDHGSERVTLLQLKDWLQYILPTESLLHTTFYVTESIAEQAVYGVFQ